MDHQDFQRKEARIFGKYLIGKNIDSTIAERYLTAIDFHGLYCKGRDQKLEQFIVKFPFWIGCVDAALALKDSQSVLRKKIFVMLGILETVPGNSSLFLSQKAGLFTLIKMIFVGIRCIYRFLIGYLLIIFFWKE